MKVAELQQRLRDEGLDRDADGMEGQISDDTPWYVRLMLALGAWLAALILILALAMFRLMESESGRLFIGVAMTGLAWALGRAPGKQGEFFSQIRLALSLAGLGCLMTVPSMNGDLQTWHIMVQAILALVFLVCQDGRTRMFIVAASGAVLAYATHNEVRCEALVLGSSFLLCLLWFQRDRWWLGRWRWACYPVAYGLTPVVYLYVWMLHWDRQGLKYTLVTTSLLTLLALWTTARIQRSLDMGPLSRLALFLAAVLLGLSTWSSPGACVGYSLLVMGTYYRLLPLKVIATFLMITSVSLHYYDMSWTLMTKSMVLLAAGTLLVALAIMIKSPPEVES